MNFGWTYSLLLEIGDTCPGEIHSLLPSTGTQNHLQKGAVTGAPLVLRKPRGQKGFGRGDAQTD